MLGLADFNYTANWTGAVTNVTSIGGGTGAVLTFADNSVSKVILMEVQLIPQ